ncbi:hypothetical protein FRC12_007640 [Ceratobasidium sp. 428]|nr:hypothetical protein FRC12_007640 [Ceratobasidium sp. 428]
MSARRRLLDGIRVVEFAGLVPVSVEVESHPFIVLNIPSPPTKGPFCGLILADLGATVIRVDTLSSIEKPMPDLLCRGKKSIAISAKTPGGRDALVELISRSDVVIDTFRDGVLERFGLGPKVFLGPRGKNPRLIYARLAGFDRNGEFGEMAGHDLNYLAHSGVLGMLPPSSPDGRPSFPLNIMASMSGGMLCANGILAALLSLARSPTAQGLVVEADLVSGTRYFSSLALLFALLSDNPFYSQPPGQGIVDGGAPFYNSYRCADGRWMSVSCYEPHFYGRFCKLMVESVGSEFCAPQNAVCPEPHQQNNRGQWGGVALWLEAAFKTRSQLGWKDIFKGSDICVIPVLTPAEAARIHGSEPAPHPNFVDINRCIAGGRTSLRESTSPVTQPPSILKPGTHTFEVLRSIGIDDDGIDNLQKQRALGHQTEGRVKARL